MSEPREQHEQAEVTPDAIPEHGVESVAEVAVDPNEQPVEQPADSTAEEQLQAAEDRAVQAQEEVLRIRAEADNIRKRAARDAEQSRKFALERFMRDLLEVKDNLERGLEAAQAEDAALDQLREGTDLTLKTLGKTLEKHGLSEIEPAGELFDPELHEALSMVPSADHPANTVVTVIQKGYLLNGRLLRPARVMVAKAPDE